MFGFDLLCDLKCVCSVWGLLRVVVWCVCDVVIVLCVCVCLCVCLRLLVFVCALN